LNEKKGLDESAFARHRYLSWPCCMTCTLFGFYDNGLQHGIQALQLVRCDVVGDKSQVNCDVKELLAKCECVLMKRYFHRFWTPAINETGDPATTVVNYR
jgi:hypothetical protein